MTTGTEIVKAETDPGPGPALSDKEFADRLEAIAQDIQHLERQAIFRIANRLRAAERRLRRRTRAVEWRPRGPVSQTLPVARRPRLSDCAR